MQNSRRLNALCSFFAVMVGSLVGFVGSFGFALASAPFEQDFDGYSLGSLVGQDSWQVDSWYNGVVVENTETPLGTGNALELPVGYGYAGREGNALSAGSVYVHFKAGGVPQAGSTFLIGYGINGGDFINAFVSDCDATTCHIGQGGYTAEFTIADWHSFGAVWTSRYAFDLYLDNVLIHSYTGMNGSANGVNAIRFGYFQPADSKLYIDNITADFLPLTPPVIEGYAPILTPTLPERNAESIVDFDAGFEVSGSVEIPTANTHAYKNLVITFRKPDSFFPAKTLSINLGNLIGGQSVNYSATTTIPITTSGVNFFKVGYALTGSTYAGSYANNPPISEDMLAFDNTWVKDSVEDAPAYLITPSIKPEQDAMEDCGAYSGIDAVVCNFRNFIVGAFLPTDEALAQIGGTMDALKNKFPMNYATAISNTFSTITAGVDDDAGFSMTLLGHTGAVDTSFFTQDIGGGATLGALIKLVLTFLVFMIFLYWGIGYMHRILNK